MVYKLSYVFLIHVCLDKQHLYIYQKIALIRINFRKENTPLFKETMIPKNFECEKHQQHQTLQNRTIDLQFSFVLGALIDQGIDGAIMEFLFLKKCDIDETWFRGWLVSLS